LLDERLSPAEQDTALEHLSECPECQRELETLAAEPSWWREASRFLHPAEFDVSSTSSVQLVSENAASDDFLLGDFACDFLEPSDNPVALGRLGKYEISEVLGRGGMGVVLKGFDRELNRYVAVKALAPHLAASAAARRRFAWEAQAAAAVVHPHVVAIHNVDALARLPYLVMPLVTGESLQQRLDRCGPLAVKEILRIALQAAQGLAAAHAQGLVHRDVKPANILLENAGVDRVMLTDFGLARAADDASLTRSGVIPGTPQYMSPEQARGESADFRSDLFSLGSVLYAMCAGHPPFRAESALAVLRRISDESPRPIREINPDTPLWLARIVERLHAKRPEDRYSSAADLARVLEQCLAYVQQPTRAALPVELSKPAASPHGRRRAGLLAAVILTTLALLAAIWQGFAGRENAPRDANRASASAGATGNPNAPPQTFEGSAAAKSKPQVAKDAGFNPAWDDGLDGELYQIDHALRRLEMLDR
jgi:serine/threonine-protein kinase